jgi:hypothetical protein
MLIRIFNCNKDKLILEKNLCLFANFKSTSSLSKSENDINRTNQKSKHDYSKTLNLPNFGEFELSMKKICENEEKIKKVKLNFHESE